MSLSLCPFPLLAPTHARTLSLSKINLKIKDIYNKSKWLKTYRANTKASVAVLISDRADFKVREVIRDTEGHHMMIKKSVLQEDITLLYVYAANNRASNCVRQNPTELQGEIDEFTIMVGNLSTFQKRTYPASREPVRT